MHGVLSILIIVSVVLVLEHIFAILIETTADTPFEKMIHAIQSEMMIGEIYFYLYISSYNGYSWGNGIWLQINIKWWCTH